MENLWYPFKPNSPTGAYVAYTKNICWISNTYYVPLNNHVPDRIEDRESKQLTYYQWVPIIFLFQALLFKVGAHYFNYQFPPIVMSYLIPASRSRLDKSTVV